MGENSIIELVNVSKSFDDEKVLDNINLKIKEKEFLTLLGPSGCGKTTTLRIIGGFAYPDTGDVFFDGQKINNLPPYKREVNTVFQKYALFPFLNVYENIAFGLNIKKMPKAQIKEKVERMLELVNLKGYEKRDVTSLSGGQQQRIAIARALVNEPKVLLLDEPLGALDLKLRKEMQVELKTMQQQLGITFVYVTHDQEEALTMSDTIVVMNNGVIQQVGSPTDIYNEPKNSFVADFIGDSNIFQGRMTKDYSVYFAGHTFECVDPKFKDCRNVEVIVRPEDVDLTAVENGKLTGYVDSIIFKGVHYEISVVQGDNWWTVHSTDGVDKGATVGISLEPDAIHIMRKEDTTNIFDAEVLNENSISFVDTDFKCDTTGFKLGEEVFAEIDAQDIRLVNAEDGIFVAEVDTAIFKGDHYEIISWVDDEHMFTLLVDDVLEQGSKIGISFDTSKIKLVKKEAE